MAPARPSDDLQVTPAVRLPAAELRWRFSRSSGPVTARKDDAPAAVQAAMANVAGLGACSGGGGLIQTTSG
jgi:hypothetical protein